MANNYGCNCTTEEYDNLKAILQSFEDRLNAIETRENTQFTFKNYSSIPSDLENGTLFVHNGVLKFKDETGTIKTVTVV